MTRMRFSVVVAIVVASALAAASAASARVLRVGSYHRIAGQFHSIQAAVNAAEPGDWILIAPGDYHEQGIRRAREPAGVLVKTARLHIRGMNRNTTIVDGTKRHATRCSSRRRDQELPRYGRNGIEVFKASGVYIENLTVCNFLYTESGDEGNQVWWNGGDGSGKIGLRSWWGNYLTATSTYSNGAKPPYAAYGIYVSNSRGPGALDNSYASNMGDSSYYVGACPDCNAVINHAHAQGSALGFSGTNAGGNLIVENSEFDHNKDGPVSNSLNNDDAPSPQNGHCPNRRTGPLGNGICDIWRHNLIDNNNNSNVPGSGAAHSLAGEIVAGIGFVFAGARYTELVGNRIVNNGAWGVLIADLADGETPPPVAHCQGGRYVVPPPAPSPLCYYQSFGNVVADNTFAHNGSFGNPTNRDIGLYAEEHDPGNCFAGNTDPDGLSSEPANIQSSPFDPCGQTNGSTDPTTAGQLRCALKIVPCPPGTNYPQPAHKFTLKMAPRQPTMSDPCARVPANPWCPVHRSVRTSPSSRAGRA
jgi:hypothetical protein